jgi:hypothetical protein
MSPNPVMMLGDDADRADLLHQLRRVFGDKIDSPMRAKAWLWTVEPALGAMPVHLFTGAVPQVPAVLGLQRVLDHLRDQPEATG